MIEVFKSGLRQAHIVERTRRLYGFSTSIRMAQRLSRRELSERESIVNTGIRSVGFWAGFYYHFSREIIYGMTPRHPTHINVPAETLATLKKK